jgi:hypothetical protein
MHKIDLGVEVDDWHSPVVAIDGSNMVVVGKGVFGRYNGDYHQTVATGVFGDYQGNVIEFFSLANGGVWKRSNSFKKGIDSDWDYASLSDKTAFVGISSVEMRDQILVYEQNTIGEWEEIQDPFDLRDDVELSYVSFDIDGDLACISDWISNQTHILHRTGSKWIHFDTKNGTRCHIFGDTVAIDQEVSMQGNITTTQKLLLEVQLFRASTRRGALTYDELRGRRTCRH